jgi:hypothetical protein
MHEPFGRAQQRDHLLNMNILMKVEKNLRIGNQSYAIGDKAAFDVVNIWDHILDASLVPCFEFPDELPALPRSGADAATTLKQIAESIRETLPGFHIATSAIRQTGRST